MTLEFYGTDLAKYRLETARVLIDLVNEYINEK